MTLSSEIFVLVSSLVRFSPKRNYPIELEVIFCVRGVISPLLANVYLNPLDHLMAQQGWDMIRYADDFVILCSSRQEAEQALEQVRIWMAKAGLSLHPTKTRIVNAAEAGGFDFLGYHFERGYRWPRQKSLKRWPNDYFVALGLISLASARAKAANSR